MPLQNNQGECECREYYEGKACEQIICVNGGWVSKDRRRCHCPDNNRHFGLHCQQTRCENSGRDTGSGVCACVDDWYTGDFCQNYSSPWG